MFSSVLKLCSTHYFLFDLVFIKKIIKLIFYKKKLKPVSVRFGFLGQTGSNQFGSVCLGFFRFNSVFSGLARFFFGLGSVRFFWFQAYKTEPVSFFKILIGFFHSSVFSVIFFWFFSFFAH